MGKYNKQGSCPRCHSTMRSDHVTRHLASCSKAPAKITANHSMCPICKNIMQKSYVKAHMVALHGKSREINVRAFKKENKIIVLKHPDVQTFSFPL